MSTATKPLLRWSSVRACPRKAVYEWQGAPARERTPQEEGVLWRGKSIGRDYSTFLATEQHKTIWVDSGHDYWVPPDLRAASRDSAGLICETKIEWPLGIGHADIYIPETRTIVEILSSAHASDQMRHSKLLQLVGYLAHHDEAENGALVVINPSDFTHDRTVLMPSSSQYAALLEEMFARIEQVQEWNQSGTLPGRVCGKPADARQHFCQHADHCFEGWEQPEPEYFAADEELIVAAERFLLAKNRIATDTASLKEWEAAKKEAQAVLEAAELPAGRSVMLGPFALTRTQVQRKPTFDWEKAEMAGRFEPGLYGEFFKPGASYSTFKAERVDVSGDEFGDEAPF